MPNGWGYAPAGHGWGEKGLETENGQSSEQYKKRAESQLSSAPWNDGSSFVTKETVAQKYTPNEQV